MTEDEHLPLLAEQRERRAIFEDRVRTLGVDIPGYEAKWRRLEGLVLPLGGYAIVPRFDADPFLDALIETGQGFQGSGIRRQAGMERECHKNAVTLWRTGEALAIGTGYALSGGLWREHSWAWDDEGTLVETTEGRSCYFGIQMSGDSARRFAEWVAPEAG